MFINRHNDVDVDELERVNAAMAHHLELIQEYKEQRARDNEEA